MAPKQKRPSPLDDPPSDSDEDSQEPLSTQQQQQQQQRKHREEDENDEEETSSEEEEDDDDDEEEEETQPAPKNPQPANSRSIPKYSSSESDSATESDSEPDLPPPKVKSLTSTPAKPKDQTPKTKPPPPPVVQAKSASKRPAENNGHSSSDPKRAKKKVTVDGSAAAASDDEDAKKPSSEKKLFQRVFSEEDEIAILKGLVEFSSKMKGTDPLKNPEAFHDFLKGSKSLGYDASSKQLKQKVARLKKKFENNAGRGKNGNDPNFSKPHDQKSFELSKKIWGNVDEASNEKFLSATPEKKSSSIKTPAKAKAKPEEKAKTNSEKQLLDSKEIEKTDEKIETSLVVSSMMMFDRAVSLCGLGEDLIKSGVELIEPRKRAELEGKWRELRDAELELGARRAQLIAEQYKLVAQAKKSSKN